MSNHFLSHSTWTLLFSARSWAVVFLVGLVVIGLSCMGHGGLVPDIPPIVRLANLPPAQDTIKSSNPRLTLYWIGDDPDGYVVGFRYRWSYPINGVVYERPWSTILNIGAPKSGGETFALMMDTANYTRTHGALAYNGQMSQNYIVPVYKFFATINPDVGLDSSIGNRLFRGDTVVIQGVRVFASNPDTLVQPFPIHVNPNSGTFIFDSQDSLNFHTFEIEAIDNVGVVGPPAKISFNTLRVTMPRTQINSSPSRKDTVLVIDHTTDTFGGIEFAFSGIDPNSRTLQFSWNLDSLKNPNGSLQWSDWTTNSSTAVTAADFDPTRKYQTTHVFSVRCRNEFGAIDTAGFYANITTNGGTNDPQSLTRTVEVRLDKHKSGTLAAGSYSLIAEAGTIPGTMKLTYNHGVPRNNVRPNTPNIVLDGDTAGILTINTNGLPTVLPQTDSVAVIIASATFNTLYPHFAKDPNWRQYLILNNSYHWGPGKRPAYSDIDSFYTGMFHDLGKDGLYRIWDVHPPLNDTDKTGFPSLGQLSNFSTVFLVADADSFYNQNIGGVYGFPPTKYMFNTSEIQALQTYCFMGGKLVISASNILSAANSDPTLYNIIHINNTAGFLVDYDYGLEGATGDTSKGYPSAVWDRSKLDTTDCPFGALREAWVVTPIGFGERIYAFRSTGACDTLYRGYLNGQIVGMRYEGVTYSVVYYGFPLYYCTNAKAIVGSTLNDIEKQP